MKRRTKVYIIRHGKSEGNLEHRFQGNRTNSRLSELGARQAALVAKRLSRTRIDTVYYSPLDRAKETALIVFKGRKIPLIGENELLERDFGQLDGLSLEEIKTRHPHAEDFYHGRITEISGFGVEPISRLQERSFAFLKKLVEQNRGKRIALVGHLFWSKSLLSKILGIPYEEIQKIRVGNASITIIDATHLSASTTFKVKKIGDERHLKGN